MSEPTDAELVRKTAAGNHEAFVSLIRRHQDYLSAVIHYEISDPDHAEDVWQETLMLIWQDREKLPDVVFVRAWMLTVARNRCVAFFRSKQRRDVPTDDGELTNIMTRLGEDTRRNDLVTAVIETIDLAPQQQRQLLSWFYLEGLTIREIASQQRIPEGTVKRRLYTARASLRRAVNPQPDRNVSMTMKAIDQIGIFQEQRPTIEITKRSGSVPESIECRELRNWHIVPRLGDGVKYATYEAPDWRISDADSLRVAGPASVHDQECMKIELKQWSCREAHHPLSMMFGREKGDSQEWLAVINDSVYTYLDRGFDVNWGKIPSKLVSGVFLESDAEHFETTRQTGAGIDRIKAGKSTYTSWEGIVGQYSVQIGSQAHECLRLMQVSDFQQPEGGTLLDVYLNNDNRTVLSRRYNGRLWGNDYETPWDVELPDSNTIEVDGVTYVHWYDQIVERQSSEGPDKPGS